MVLRLKGIKKQFRDCSAIAELLFNLKRKGGGQTAKT